MQPMEKPNVAAPTLNNQRQIFLPEIPININAPLLAGHFIL
jgi:hypothetical protein